MSRSFLYSATSRQIWKRSPSRREISASIGSSRSRNRTRPASLTPASPSGALYVRMGDTKRTGTSLGASEETGGEGLAAGGERLQRVAALLDDADGQAAGRQQAADVGEDRRLEAPGAV